MKNILDECDVCLSEKAQEEGGSAMFETPESVIEWATLAEECGLQNLLATAELFMIKVLDVEFWQSESSLKLSPTCLLRVLQGAQHHTRSSARICNEQLQTTATNQRILG